MKPDAISGVLESCLYVNDLERAEQFYTEVLGLELQAKIAERHLFFRCGQGMLLLFYPEKTLEMESKIGESIIPRHGAKGPGHVAFSLKPLEIDTWRDWLRQHKVEIESEVAWPGGGHSIYFRDPSNNSLELTSPIIWGIES